MGETANAALFAIVYAKGLVGRDRLQAALDKATLEGLPLENVLVQTGILGRPQCEELLRVRNRLGRLCSSCGGTTFLLQDETEATASCEFCGGRLLPPRATGAVAPPAARPAPPQPPAQGQRRASAAAPAVPPQAERRPSAASASGRLDRLSAAAAGTSAPVPPAPGAPPQGAPASAEALAERITQHVLAVVETRLAQEDLVGFLNSVVQKATQQAVETMTARLDALAQQAAKRALGEVDARIEAAREPLTRRIAADVKAGLKLPDTSQLEAAAGEAARRAAAETLAEHDLEGLPARVTEQVLEQVQDHLARHDLGGLREQVQTLSASDVARVEAGDVEAQVDAILERRLGELQARLGEGRGGEALSAEDVAELAERKARSVAREVAAEVAGGSGAGAAAPDPGQVQALVEESVAELRARLEELEARPAGAAELDPDAFKRIKDEVLQAVFVQDSPPASDVARLDPLQLGAQVYDSVRQQILERLDELAEQATGPVLKNIEKKVADLGLKTLPQRIKAEVLESIESSGGPIGGSGGGSIGDVDAIQKKLMSAVETRLAEFDMAVESAIQETTSRAVEAVEQRISQLEEQSGERAPLAAPAAGPPPEELLEEARRAALDAVEERLRSLPQPAADDRSSGPATGVYDRKFIALAREVKGIKDSLEKGTLGGGAAPAAAPGDSERQIRSYLDSDDFKGLLESRIEARLLQVGPAASVGTTSTPAAPAAAGASPDMVALLGTVEFKQMFDTKINEVLKYLRNDLIPSTVKKTLREVEQKS